MAMASARSSFRPRARVMVLAIRDTQFGAEVELELLFPEANVSAFFEKLTDMTSGTVEGMETGKEYRAFPIDT